MARQLPAWAETRNVAQSIDRLFTRPLSEATLQEADLAAEYSDASTDYIKAMLLILEGELCRYRSRGKDFQNRLLRYRVAKRAFDAIDPSRPPPPVTRPPNPPQPKSGIIYFLQSGDFVKIGFTTNLTSRLTSLATASPTTPTLLRSREGTSAEERQYHKRFVAYHSHREWFRLEGELADYIAGLPK